MFWSKWDIAERRETLKKFQSDPEYPSMGIFLGCAKTFIETQDKGFELASLATLQALPRRSRNLALRQLEGEARGWLDVMSEPGKPDGKRRKAWEDLQATIAFVHRITRLPMGLGPSTETARALAVQNPALKEAIDRTDLDAVKRLSPLYTPTGTVDG